MKQRNVILEWDEVKQKMIRIVDGKGWGDGPNASHYTASEWVQTVRRGDKAKKNNWEGGSLADTQRHLQNGFFAKEFEHSAEYVPMSNMRHPHWGDEPDGDIDISRLYGGYDEYYFNMAEGERKPGLRVMLEMAFAAGMENKTIRDYGAWCAGLLASLESSGYDLTVDIWVRLDNLFQNFRNERHNVLIRVKRQNELSDFTEWSALFGPTGYRHIVFCAKMVAGDKIGSCCTTGLGTTIQSEWNLDYDPEDSTLKIMVNQRGGYGNNDGFPHESLNRQARELGLI